MSLVRENWVQIAAFLLLLLMSFVGFHRGMFKTLFSLLSIPLSAFISNYAEPFVQDIVDKNEAFRDFISSWVRNILQEGLSRYLSSAFSSSAGTDSIELGKGFFPSGDMVFPGNFSGNGTGDLSGLLRGLTGSSSGTAELNPASFSEMAGLQDFIETMSQAVTEMLLKAILFLLLMVLVNLLLKLAFHFLDRLVRLPGLNLANRVLGAFFGILQGVFYLWIFLLVLSILPDNALVSDISRQCNQAGSWLWYLKEYNLLSHLFLALAM